MQSRHFSDEELQVRCRHRGVDREIGAESAEVAAFLAHHHTVVEREGHLIVGKCGGQRHAGEQILGRLLGSSRCRREGDRSIRHTGEENRRACGNRVPLDRRQSHKCLLIVESVYGIELGVLHFHGHGSVDGRVALCVGRE